MADEKMDAIDKVIRGAILLACLRAPRLRAQGICPACQDYVMGGNLRDKKSREEYRISGLCQKCQDEVRG